MNYRPCSSRERTGGLALRCRPDCCVHLPRPVALAGVAASRAALEGHRQEAWLRDIRAGYGWPSWGCRRLQQASSVWLYGPLGRRSESKGRAPGHCGQECRWWRPSWPAGRDPVGWGCRVGVVGDDGEAAGFKLGSATEAGETRSSSLCGTEQPGGPAPERSYFRYLAGWPMRVYGRR